MALIVNADDFGKDKSVSDAIAQAFEQKLIDRTTLMVNMPYAEEAMELAKQAGFSDRVGLHLNLTSGRPLTVPVSKDPVMCRASGEFSADFARNMKQRFFFPKQTAAGIEKEIRAQLDKYRELGGTLWHIDSHHHVHTDPSVWRILKRVLKDYPVTSVRLGRNMYRGGSPVKHIFKALQNRSIRLFCMETPDYFGSAYDYLDYFPDPHEASAGYNIEVMVHPVFDDDNKLCDLYEEKYHKLTELH